MSQTDNSPRRFAEWAPMFALAIADFADIKAVVAASSTSRLARDSLAAVSVFERRCVAFYHNRGHRVLVRESPLRVDASVPAPDRAPDATRWHVNGWVDPQIQDLLLNKACRQFLFSLPTAKAPPGGVACADAAAIFVFAKAAAHAAAGLSTACSASEALVRHAADAFPDGAEQTPTPQWAVHTFESCDDREKRQSSQPRFRRRSCAHYPTTFGGSMSLEPRFDEDEPVGEFRDEEASLFGVAEELTKTAAAAADIKPIRKDMCDADIINARPILHALHCAAVCRCEALLALAFVGRHLGRVQEQEPSAVIPSLRQAVRGLERPSRAVSEIQWKIRLLRDMAETRFPAPLCANTVTNPVTQTPVARQFFWRVDRRRFTEPSLFRGRNAGGNPPSLGTEPGMLLTSGPMPLRGGDHRAVLAIRPQPSSANVPGLAVFLRVTEPAAIPVTFAILDDTLDGIKHNDNVSVPLGFDGPKQRGVHSMRATTLEYTSTVSSRGFHFSWESIAASSAVEAGGLSSSEEEESIRAYENAQQEHRRTRHRTRLPRTAFVDDNHSSSSSGERDALPTTSAVVTERLARRRCRQETRRQRRIRESARIPTSRRGNNEMAQNQLAMLRELRGECPSGDENSILPDGVKLPRDIVLRLEVAVPPPPADSHLVRYRQHRFERMASSKQDTAGHRAWEREAAAERERRIVECEDDECHRFVVLRMARPLSPPYPVEEPMCCSREEAGEADEWRWKICPVPTDPGLESVKDLPANPNSSVVDGSSLDACGAFIPHGHLWTLLGRPRTQREWPAWDTESTNSDVEALRLTYTARAEKEAMRVCPSNTEALTTPFRCTVMSQLVKLAGSLETKAKTQCQYHCVDRLLDHATVPPASDDTWELMWAICATPFVCHVPPPTVRRLASRLADTLRFFRRDRGSSAWWSQRIMAGLRSRERRERCSHAAWQALRRLPHDQHDTAFGASLRAQIGNVSDDEENLERLSDSSDSDSETESGELMSSPSRSRPFRSCRAGQVFDPSSGSLARVLLFEALGTAFNVGSCPQALQIFAESKKLVCELERWLQPFILSRLVCLLDTSLISEDKWLRVDHGDVSLVPPTEAKNPQRILPILFTLARVVSAVQEAVPSDRLAFLRRECRARGLMVLVQRLTIGSLGWMTRGAVLPSQLFPRMKDVELSTKDGHTKAIISGRSFGLTFNSADLADGVLMLLRGRTESVRSFGFLVVSVFLVGPLGDTPQ